MCALSQKKLRRRFISRYTVQALCPNLRGAILPKMPSSRHNCSFSTRNFLVSFDLLRINKTYIEPHKDQHTKNYDKTFFRRMDIDALWTRSRQRAANFQVREGLSRCSLLFQRSSRELWRWMVKLPKPARQWLHAISKLSLPFISWWCQTDLLWSVLS